MEELKRVGQAKRERGKGRGKVRRRRRRQGERGKEGQEEVKQRREIGRETHDRGHGEEKGTR
eukprot:2268146-Rhodomonas_salina.2